jgi:uncharacterized repeat protein (TIGR02543 family)
MKKRFVSLLVALSITLTFLPIGAVAATPIKFTDGNLIYTVNADGESVTVSGTSGSPTQLTIESSISDKNYTVTKIAMWAFNNARNTLTEVTLPNTVDEIGYQAFFNCSNLTKVIIPEGVTKIGQAAFYGCSQLTSITIPSTITNMDTAFSGNTALSHVTLTNGISNISSMAFKGCTGLTEIKVPESVGQIGPNAFNGCTNLKRVLLEKNIKTININAFKDCTNLSDVKYNGHKKDWDNVTVNNAGNDTLTSKVQYLCDINFDLDGGTVNGSNTVDKQTVYSNEKLGTAKCYPNDQPFVVPTDPVREGYTFLGWYQQDATAPTVLAEYVASDNVTFTANWTQKDAIDPDVDLKFDAVTGEVTSNNTQVNADDIINRKFYDDKGNEVPGEKLNDRGLPTEPGDYIVKVDVKETENTAPANQITGNQIKWSYNVPQKEEKVTYALSLLGGIAKVNGKDATINDNGDITIEKGATVEVTFDKSILSDAQTFDQWTIKPASVLSAVEPKAETITFTMPGENVIIEAMTKDASIEEEPNILGTTLIIGTAAAGTAVLAYQTYQLGTEFYLICALPTGTAIPTNRGELAELVWNNAGKPEPAAVLNANATETDKAIAWAVENDLLKAAKSNGETYEATDPVSRTEVIKAWNQVQAFKK